MISQNLCFISKQRPSRSLLSVLSSSTPTLLLAVAGLQFPYSPFSFFIFLTLTFSCSTPKKKQTDTLLIHTKTHTTTDKYAETLAASLALLSRFFSFKRSSSFCSSPSSPSSRLDKTIDRQ